MKKKNSLILDDEFIEYCELNNIRDIDKLARQTFNRGFTILKFGETPYGMSPSEKIVEKIVEKEVIKEIIKEVPIEKIVEVIKEVTVTGEPQVLVQEILKEVKVEDTEQISRLIEENKKLRDELESVNTTLDKFNKAKYLKNSDLSNLYGE